MIVSFDPSAGSTVTNMDAIYINFLRCVTAIATANAGVSSITVVPYTSTSAVNNSLNCITAIVANTESGGWFTSSVHDVPTAPASFTAMSSRASYSAMYKADFWNSSGKSAMPFDKMTFHAIGHNSQGSDAIWNGRINTNPLTNWTTSTSGGQLQYTFGCSTTEAGDSNYVPTWSGTTPNQQTNSWTMNGYISNTGGQTSGDVQGSNNFPGPAHAFNLFNYGSVTYTMAVTATYCIIWENHRSNSYTNNFSNSYTNPNGNMSISGGLMYGGLRTTQPWEDTIANNPPWVAWNITHRFPAGTSMGSYNFVSQQQTGPSTNSFNSWDATSPQPPNSVAAFMSVVDNTGLVSTNPARYQNYPPFQYWRNNVNVNVCPVTTTGYSSAAGQSDGFFANPAYGNGTFGIATPLFYLKGKKSSQQNSLTTATHNPYLPTIDTVTGTFVPGAYPIKIQRTTNNEWNPGGDCRGIYKSLSMPIANMKLYWSENQIFTVDGEPYMPIVFHEDMYLIRRA